MAQSLAHRWGQIIGDGFEMFVRSILEEVAQRHGLYLDFKRPRSVRGGQGKVTWQDGYGNKHDLDYVLERGGTEEKLGVPVAFIESAWRRYTKHSKNKVQEVEAAVMPVALTFSRHQPFCGGRAGRRVHAQRAATVGVQRVQRAAHSLRVNSGRVQRT